MSKFGNEAATNEILKYLKRFKWTLKNNLTDLGKKFIKIKTKRHIVKEVGPIGPR